MDFPQRQVRLWQPVQGARWGKLGRGLCAGGARWDSEMRRENFSLLETEVGSRARWLMLSETEQEVSLVGEVRPCPKRKKR